jgi:hypothetical protein
MPVRPADAPHGGRQRAEAADSEEQVEAAVAEDEVAVELEPEPGLETGAR